MVAANFITIMSSEYNLERFIEAQKTSFEIALSEIKMGRKKSHWMWYIFPQLQGLGFSETSKFYAIKNIDEARAFLDHPLLGERLLRICNELLNLQSNNAHNILGSPDDLKLQSSMTLFSSLNINPVFQKILEKFFSGIEDDKTLEIIGRKE